MKSTNTFLLLFLCSFCVKADGDEIKEITRTTSAARNISIFKASEMGLTLNAIEGSTSFNISNNFKIKANASSVQFDTLLTVSPETEFSFNLDTVRSSSSLNLAIAW